MSKPKYKRGIEKLWRFDRLSERDKTAIVRSMSLSKRAARADVHSKFD